MSNQQWSVASDDPPPEWFVAAVRRCAPDISGQRAAQLLWQRGIRTEQQLMGFVNPQAYQPASPFEFGQEIQQAVERLERSHHANEIVAIWGDFDADGITATAVLWDGLGQFFAQKTQLLYYIPNRLRESHGLNRQGIDALAQKGTKLIVTCDTGSTNISEIEYANQLGLDVIITDHHTLPPERPPVVAIINPRYLPLDHQMFHLSGVAVAYKLVEAVYQTFPYMSQQPLEDLLDLVAIGLIADLVELSGDCRYLAQLGIEKLQQDLKQPASMRRRPGIGRLLELCQKSGDRPTDISFGLGPRINAVSRIQGDASFCVELLTSRDLSPVTQMAQATELANARRKALQKEVSDLVAQKLTQLDLSTTSVIVLEDAQWPVGVLGLVAGQVAQETGCPTILLSTETEEEERIDRDAPLSPPAPNPQRQSPQVGKPAQGAGSSVGIPSSPEGTPLPLCPSAPLPPLACGSARSVNQIDLYQLVKDQAHLLHRFGGHPFAAGLSLPIENIPLFREAINQRLRRHFSSLTTPVLQADLVVTVADLGKDLFRELKLIEPCGMGNPVPNRMLQNCWFENTWHRNLQDVQGKNVQYIKTEFDIRDDSTKSGFAGMWWGHYKEELPSGRCDCIAELDYNTYKKRYEIRLIAVRTSTQNPSWNTTSTQMDWLLDWRGGRGGGEWRRGGQGEIYSLVHPLPPVEDTFFSPPLLVQKCPTSWDELRAWFRRALYLKQPLALAWMAPQVVSPSQVWLSLVGIAKYLSRTGQTVTRHQLHQKLGIGDHPLHIGFKALTHLGFKVSSLDQGFSISATPVEEPTVLDTAYVQSIEKFLATVREEQFQQQYFYQVPLSRIQAIAAQTV